MCNEIIFNNVSFQLFCTVFHLTIYVLLQTLVHASMVQVSDKTSSHQVTLPDIVEAIIIIHICLCAVKLYLIMFYFNCFAPFFI